MTVGQALRTAIVEKYFTFRGRAARKEYWTFWLFFTGLGFLLDVVLTGMPEDSLLSLIPLLILVLLFPPFLAVSVRRVHDQGEPGWLVILFLVPVIGLIFWLYWCARRGNSGRNKYGPDPLLPPDSELVDFL